MRPIGRVRLEIQKGGIPGSACRGAGRVKKKAPNKRS